jgi:hypothetical protein
MFGSDTSLIMNIELALIGIIVVLGLFYLWRAIGRLENRLNVLSSQVCASATCPMPQHVYPPQPDPLTEEEAAEAQAFMDHVFGGFRPEPIPAPANVVVEDTSSSSVEATIPAAAPDDAHSEAESTSLSKNRLKKLNADQLRELCASAGLSTEGTRAMLIERLQA